MTCNESEIILYQSADDVTKMDVRIQNKTVRLSIDQMASLLSRDKSTISRHTKIIFEEGELILNSLVANYATTVANGNRYQVDDFANRYRKGVLHNAGSVRRQAAFEKATEESISTRRALQICPLRLIGIIWSR